MSFSSPSSFTSPTSSFIYGDEPWGCGGMESRIRPLTLDDLPAVRELRSVVGWSADPEAFELLRGMRAARWAVAEDPESRGSGLDGMVGAVPLGPVGVLCHLAVRRESRGAGLGGALSRWAVAYLRSRGVRTVRLYSTAQAEGLYRSLGFRPVRRRWIFTSPETSQLGNAELGRESRRCSVETLTFGDLPEIYGLDWWSSGLDRSHVILKTLSLHPGRGLLARDSDGRIAGYLIRSSPTLSGSKAPGPEDSEPADSGGTRIGPFAASTREMAARLLSWALRSGGGRLASLTLTEGEDSPAHALLREFGFSGAPNRLAMELGDPVRERGLELYATTAYLAT